MTHIFKLPNGLAICASALLCAAVVALQNAELYATKLEAPVQTLSTLLLRLPDDLRAVGSATHATELNSLEKTHIAALSSVLSPEAQADETYIEQQPISAESVAETKPAAVAEQTIPAEPVVEVQPAAVAEQPIPAEPVAEVQPTAVLPAEAPMPLMPDAKPSIAQEGSPVVPGAVVNLPAEVKVNAPSELMMPGEAKPAVAQERTLAEPVAAVGTERPAEPISSEAPVEKTPLPADAAPASSVPEPPLAAISFGAANKSGLTQAPPMRYHIMLVGDSLMEDLGPLTHKTYKNRKGLDFVISAKYSTGLCRPDIFDWPKHMRENVNKRRPDLVVFFIGANDGLSIKEGKRLVPTGGKTWRDAYGRKMDELISIAREVGAEVIWVEMPAIGGRYNKVYHETQIAQREYCQSHGIASLQTDPLLSGEWGKFEIFGTYKGKTVRLRTTDDTHLTPDGNRKVLEVLQPMIEERMIAFYQAHPERRLSESEVKKIRNVPAVYTCQYTPPQKAPAAEQSAAQQP